MANAEALPLAYVSPSLLQRSHSVREAASRKRKEKEKEYSTEIMDLQRIGDPDYAMSNMGFPPPSKLMVSHHVS